MSVCVCELTVRRQATGQRCRRCVHVRQPGGARGNGQHGAEQQTGAHCGAAAGMVIIGGGE